MYLLYCVRLLDDMETNNKRMIPGIDGGAVREIRFKGVAGVVSMLDNPPDADVKTLLTYNDVIAAYHEHRTILPMRFGAFFRQRAHMMTALENNSETYLLKLKKLRGCTEMCIRFITVFSGAGDVEKKETGCIRKKTPGHDFLKHRKKIYEQQNCLPPEPHQISKLILQHLRGTYIEFKQECQVKQVCRFRESFISPPPPPPPPTTTTTTTTHSRIMPETRDRDGEMLVSLFFLISKEQLALFRSRFQQIGEDSSIRSVISGPWPPFNFVDPESDVAASLNGRGC